MNGDLLKDTAPAQTARSGWTPGRIIALATGSVLALFSLVLMAGCGALTWADQELARRILALQLPPAGAIAAEAARRAGGYRRAHPVASLRPGPSWPRARQLGAYDPIRTRRRAASRTESIAAGPPRSSARWIPAPSRSPSPADRWTPSQAPGRSASPARGSSPRSPTDHPDPRCPERTGTGLAGPGLMLMGRPWLAPGDVSMMVPSSRGLEHVGIVAE